MGSHEQLYTALTFQPLTPSPLAACRENVLRKRNGGKGKVRRERKVDEGKSKRNRVATDLGEIMQGLFKYLFQTYSSDVLPRDFRVSNVFGII